MNRWLCLCPELNCIPVRTLVTVIMPAAERVKTTNTGSLAPLLLEGARIVPYGGLGERFSGADLLVSGYRNAVLAPGGQAAVEFAVSAGLSAAAGATAVVEPIDAELGGRSVPVHLIVPDGTWKAASGAVNRDLVLASLPRVSVSSESGSRYALRDGVSQHRLSTLEAIALAIEPFEGARGASVRAHLDRALAMKRDRILWARGSLPAGLVAGGVPEDAVWWKRGMPRKR